MIRWVTLALLAFPVVSLQAIDIGDSSEEVIASLGMPIGELELGDRIRLMFVAGDVTFEDGQVVAHQIKTQAQLAHEANIRDKEVEYWAAVRAEDQAERLAKGRAWLDVLKDGSVQMTEAELRGIINHWSQLRADFPDAEIQDEFEATLALAETYKDELARQREAAQIAQLEQRVANAEQRAAAAEQQAFNAQRSSYYYPTYYSPPRSVVVVTNGATCPPYPAKYYNSQPIIRANVNTGNFNFRFSSGGYSSGNCFGIGGSRPIVITRAGQ